MPHSTSAANKFWNESWPLLCGLSILLITVSTYYGVIQRETSRFKLANAAKLNSIQNEVAHDFGERVRSIERMAAMLSTSPSITREQWRSDASRQLQHFPDFNSISVLKANYYIEDIQPSDLSSLIKRHPYFNWEEKRAAALKRAAEQKESTITGILNLTSGLRGIVIVSPILKREAVTGYILAVIKPEDFFKNLRIGDRYDFKVTEGGETVFSSQTEGDDSRSHLSATQTSRIYGIELTFSSTPTWQTLRGDKSYLPESILLSGLIISILFFFTLRLARKARIREVQAILSSRRLDKLLSLAPVAIFEADAEGKVTYTNLTWSRYTGISSEESVGVRWVDHLYVSDKELVLNHWKQAVQKRANFHLRFRYHRLGLAEVRWVDCRAEPIWGPKGDLLGYLGAAVDFTTQKKAEDAAREAQELLADVLDNLPVALLCKDSQNDFRFTLWNRSAEKIWHQSREEVLGRNDFELFPNAFAQAQREQDLGVIEGRTSLDLAEEVYALPEGSKHLHWRKVPVNGPDGKPRYLLGIAEDITEKVLSQRLIDEQRLIIIQAERMNLLAEMAAGIAHEINNPLTIIEGYSQQIRSLIQREDFSKERLDKAANGISATIQRIAKIIRGMKSLSRDGSQDPVESVKVADILKETLDFCQTKFTRQGVSLRVDDRTPEGTEIKCRKIQISQVLLNLLVNALDAVANSSNPRVEVLVVRDSNLTKISIIDSGEGIPAENVDKIMNPFFTTKLSGGTGLGLSISSNIMKAHGGRLYLDSSAPDTCFTLEFPHAPKVEGGPYVE